MQSSTLLNKLEQIPLVRAHDHYDIKKLNAGLSNIDRTLFSIEIGAGLEGSLNSLFEARNVPDDLREAYKKAFTQVAQNESLYEHYQEMLEKGPDSLRSFIGTLKGKLYEVRLPEKLSSEFPGYKFTIAEKANQGIWDIKGVDTDGQEILVQAKMGAVTYANDVIERMDENSNVFFSVSAEIHDKIAQLRPDLLPRLIETDVSNFDFTEHVKENLNVLAENLGIDVPDEIGDILPYLSEIILGIRFLYDIVSVERDFKSVQLEERSRMHAIKALILLSRFGISTVCTVAGGSAGTAITPGWGTVFGALTGAVVAGILRKKLQPQMISIAQWLVGVDSDDLFYFRNKERIDQLGLSFHDAQQTLVLERAA